MGKALIITEKPSVSKDIVEALGNFVEKAGGEYWESKDYICTYAIGHIFTLFSPEDINQSYKRWRLADLPIIPESFEIKPISKQAGRIKIIKKLFAKKEVTSLVNACDAAREGELIFREIAKYLKNDKPIQRLWLQSMTKQAIRLGFAKLENAEKYQGLAAAAFCRAHADWLIGMNATRALTIRLRTKNERGASWSAGRVQTPTLSLLVDRELEVLEHTPIPYWRVHAKFKVHDHEYEGVWFDPKFKKAPNDRDKKEDRIFDKKLADSIITAVLDKDGKAREVRKPSPRKAPDLFDLTSLQRVVNSKLGWTASRTLKAAQRCYETHKVLTYPRTNSKHLPEDYRDEVDNILKIISKTNKYGTFAKQLQKDGLLNTEKIFDNSKVTDHFAIVPTGELADLSGDDEKLFDLVTRQFLAAFYPPSIYEDIERITEVEGHCFKSRPPRILRKAGWEAVFNKDVDKEKTKTKEFPPLDPKRDSVEGIAASNKGANAEDLATKPPPRITEAGLLSLMENAGRRMTDNKLASALKEAEGLGTAATRAEIIEKLKQKEYIHDNLRPTVKGIRLMDIVHRIGISRLTSAELTAELELHLSEVESGLRESKEFMHEIADYTRDIVEAARNFDYDKIFQDDEALGKCPKCGLEVVERSWFYGCRESIKRTHPKKCNFLIWKDCNGRYINRNTLKILLTEGETEELDGFNSPDGRPFKAKLRLEHGNLIRESVKSEDDPSADQNEISDKPICKCPIHTDAECMVIESTNEFTCETRQSAKKDGESSNEGFSFPRFLCKRKINPEEISLFVKNGETDFLSGFISKRGRRFSAKLKHTENGRFTFVFPERGTKKAENSKKESDD